jgi:DtxR family transcriptional regulator, Mn-dependent transcriptional regulator
MSQSVGDLSASLEDYLEAILVLSRQKKVVRVRDIASYTRVAMSSVNGAVKRLLEQDLVIHERYEFVELSEKGAKLAEKILERHNLLTHLLRDILHVNPETAEKDACTIEHHLSQETLNHILDFFFFVEVCPKGAKTWKNYSHKCIEGECMDEECMDEDCSFRKIWKEGRRRIATGKKDLRIGHIRPGNSMKVVKIDASDKDKKQITEKGIDLNKTIEIIKWSSSKDTVDLKIDQKTITMTKEEAAMIVVELV